MSRPPRYPAGQLCHPLSYHQMGRYRRRRRYADPLLAASLAALALVLLALALVASVPPAGAGRPSCAAAVEVPCTDPLEDDATPPASRSWAVPPPASAPLIT